MDHMERVREELDLLNIAMDRTTEEYRRLWTARPGLVWALDPRTAPARRPTIIGPDTWPANASRVDRHDNASTSYESGPRRWVKGEEKGSPEDGAGCSWGPGRAAS